MIVHVLASIVAFASLLSIVPRLQSRGLESLTAGLQSLRLASRLKPWLRTIGSLGWMMTVSHGLHVQTIQESCAIAKMTAQCALYMGALKIFGTP